MNGKGDSIRPSNIPIKEFKENYDKIFGKKPIKSWEIWLESFKKIWNEEFKMNDLDCEKELGLFKLKDYWENEISPRHIIELYLVGKSLDKTNPKSENIDESK